jgi:hypothetical protein
MIVDPVQQHSDMHRLIWILGTVGGVGGGVLIVLGIVQWVMKMYAKACHTVAQINSIPALSNAAIQRDQETAETLKRVQTAVETTNTNHLTHIEADIRDGRAEQTKLLQDMNGNIKILVDRGLRL